MSSVKDEKQRKVVIVGAGLVGSLQALSDPRTEDNVAGRSINLALSKRGREALKAVGAEEHVVRTGIPMHARMIHSHDGKQTPIPYGKKGQYILSIDRRALNEHLISLVEKHPNVKFHFDSKCVDANLKQSEVTFQRKKADDEDFVEKGDLVVGCDGSFSKIRKHLMKLNRMDYSQVCNFL